MKIALKKLTEQANKPYADWFGQGNCKDDIEKVIKQYGNPKEILLQENGFMSCVIYKDKIIVIGYDGSEYHHQFDFLRK